MKRVLVAPLNWGLGHATRCIPLIRELECLGAQVFLASDGVALHLLRAEFPHLTAFELPSYRIRYQTTNMIRNIGPQLPRILWAVRREQWETARLVLAHGIQGVLSDNRYGCFSRRAHCVLLSHQLHLRIPGIGLSWPANGVLRLALSKFDALWVPDVAEAPGLSGQLSHGAPVHPVTHYAGILTRMRAYECEPGYDVAVVLSGPEPQRSILEQRLLEQAISMPHKFIFVQGQTQAKKHYYAADNVEVVSYLTSRDLNDVLMASKVVVSRSGYSSVMDLAGLGKKAILIPTPGQTEQEYLADFLARQQLFVAQRQDAIDLDAGIRQLSRTTGLRAGAYPADAFKPLLRAWLDGLAPAPEQKA
ncbi:MAG: glycosyltransferase [Saprospirales bacterium]|nr:glycosyltransferase [Saprospirales bacterium]